jgi:hypothetical protein
MTLIESSSHVRKMENAKQALFVKKVKRLREHFTSFAASDSRENRRQRNHGAFKGSNKILILDKRKENFPTDSSCTLLFLSPFQ